MSKHNSTSPHTQQTPQKPKGSPLWWHADKERGTGRWCKKINGRRYYFGSGAHTEALAEYERVKDDLHNGRLPREAPEGLTVLRLCHDFLEAKQEQRDGGELSPRSYLDYVDSCKRVVRVLGRDRAVSDLRVDDFAKLRRDMAKTWGPVRLANEINRAKVPFNWAYKSGKLDRPVVYGEGFKRPSKKVLRKHKADQGPRMFEAAEIRAMLKAAKPALRAMILLGINCGYSNADIGALPLKVLDLENGWATFARVKTGIPRKCPLWPETVQALRDWLAVRPEPIDDKDRELVFITEPGNGWGKLGDRAVSKETAKLLKRLGINGHRGYYALRHCTQTVGDESGDFLAVRSVMGHATTDIADVYRERVSDERLRRVTSHIRAWLYPPEAGQEPDVVKFPQKQIG
jgi:integrase